MNPNPIKITCDTCKSDQFELLGCVFSNGTRHVQARCYNCKAHRQFVPQGGPCVFHFGKHKGKPLSEVPLDYLEWILGGDLSNALRHGIEEEIKTRTSQP